MTNRYLLLTIFIFTTTFTSIAQGVGKLQINADLSAIATFDPTIEISVINMSTNKQMLREKVQDNFDFTFPLNQRFLLYFKKDGYNTTRLLLDTHTFMSGYYSVSFELDMNQEDPDSDISAIPIGTIVFDSYTTSFGFKSAGLLASQSMKVVSSIRESDVVRF